MKKYLLLIYLFVIQNSNYSYAQVNSEVNRNTLDCDSIRVSHTVNVYFSVDSLYPLNTKYTFESGEAINGKFFFDMESAFQRRKQPFLIGVYPSTSVGLDYCFNRSNNLETRTMGVFNDGVPCSKWKFISKNYTDPMNVYRLSHVHSRKDVNYNKGLLHGRFSILGSPKDTLYTTTFVNGTGYYKDYYPTYDDKRLVRLEGALINGFRDGVWIYYIRYGEDAFSIIGEKEIYLEYYDKGVLLHHLILKPNSEVKDIVKKAVEWERQPAKLRKGKENPFLE